MLKKLRLFDFRNFKEQWVTLSPKTNIFVGDNGQGKSNILEAIYLLLTGDSFRPSETQHFIRWDEQAASIRGIFVNEAQENLDLLLKIQNGKKSLTLNEKRFVSADWDRLDSPILFSPESLNSIKGSAEERRSLVDELVVNLNSHNKVLLQDYRKALRMRNKILRDHKELERPIAATNRFLEAMNIKFVELGTLLTQRRIEALRTLEPEVNFAMQSVSVGFPEIHLEYLVSQESAIHWNHEDIHNSLQKRLKELAPAELASGTSLVGPHKHDIVFLFGGNDSRFFCSQGQQRSLILAFKIAQIVYHRKVLKRRPILLLDDVLSELDGAKRKNFVELLKTMDSQIVLTTTDYDLPHVFETEASPVDLMVKRVNEGRLVD